MLQVARCRCLIIMLALCLGASMLSSCYTNYNQRLLEDYRHYTGFDINYDKGGRAPSQEPVLYRTQNNDWYMAGVKCDLEVIGAVPSCHTAFSSWYDRNETSPVRRKGQAVYYHKITPEMANRLLITHSYKTGITDSMIAASMKKAGGGWVKSLPAGARAVPAAQLSRSSVSPHWVLVDTEHTDAPWYISAASALTFICCDVPCSVVCSAAFTAACSVSSPALLYLYLADR